MMKWYNVLFFVFFALFISGLLLSVQYTHKVVVYEFGSPVPIQVVDSDSLAKYHGRGGVAGSSILKVDDVTFWKKAKEFGRVWIVADSYGWHILTFGNETFAYELKFLSYREVDEVDWSEHMATFYGSRTEHGLLWFGIYAVSIFGMVLCGFFALIDV